MLQAAVRTEVPNLFVVPGNNDLVGFETEYMTDRNRAFRMRDALTAMRGEQASRPTETPFTYILIDCPPSLNLLTLNALVAANAVIVPVQCEFFALEGISQLNESIQQIRASLNPALEIQGVVLTMHDARTGLSREVASEVRAFFGDKVYKTTIPRNVRVAEAPSFGKPILLYDYECSGSQAYVALASEIIEREKSRNSSRVIRMQRIHDLNELEYTRARMSVVQQKGRLGRGLASLIGEQGPSQTRLPAEGVQRIVPIDHIQPSPFNPRKNFREEELSELADSIREKGLVQPLIVREADNNKYEIVAGERRWRAAQRAGVHMVAVIIRELNDQEVLELAIIENVQRADLNSIEEAGGYRDLIERFNYTQDRLSEVIGKSRSHLANTLRLLKLPEIVQQHVCEGRLTPGHARPLVGRQDAEQLAELIIAKDLNVRDVEALVQKADLSKDQLQIRRVREKDPDTRAFETEVSNILGLKVEIRPGAGETGALTIKYTDFDQLDYLRMLLVGERRS